MYIIYTTACSVHRLAILLKLYPTIRLVNVCVYMHMFVINELCLLYSFLIIVNFVCTLLLIYNSLCFSPSLPSFSFSLSLLPSAFTIMISSYFSHVKDPIMV